MRTIGHHRLIMLLSLSLVGTACSQSGKQEGVNIPLGNGENAPTVPQNLVERIEIQLLEAFPAQVNVVIEGQLSNTCEKINQIISEQEGSSFTVEMTTLNQTLSNCRSTRVPFRQIVPLAVDGLRAGRYLVKVHGLTETFDLAVDNIVRWE